MKVNIWQNNFKQKKKFAYSKRLNQFSTSCKKVFAYSLHSFFVLQLFVQVKQEGTYAAVTVKQS